MWKLALNICATDDNLNKRKVKLASRCCFCKKEEESRDHILWYCNCSEIIWRWLGNMFNFINPSSFEEVFAMAKQTSPGNKEIWKVASFITIREIWFMRKKCIYEEEPCNLEGLKRRIIQLTRECEVRLKAPMWNSPYDLQMLKFFGLKSRKVNYTRVKEIFFQLPPQNQIVLCCDGASRGNPGVSGYGFIGRRHTGEFLIAFSGGLGISTNYVVEVLAILNAGEWAISEGHLEVIFRTDLAAVMLSFMKNKVPWFAENRWKKICTTLNSWNLTHSYREVNFSADNLAKKGTRLARGERILYTTRPSFLGELENPERAYYRFF